MKELMNVFGHFNVEQVVMLCCACYGLYKVLERFYKVATGYHDKQQEKEELFAMIRENQASITEIDKKLDQHIQRDREYKLGSIRDKLFVCYNAAKKQGYITRRQLENFHANLKIYYEEYDGNGPVRKKYEPEINEMEIRED